jgi:phage protein U
MFNDLIDDSSRHALVACEQTRRLEGIVTRTASGWNGTSRNLMLLVDSLGQIESAGVINMQAVVQALSQTNRLLAGGVLGVDVARTTRNLSGIANGLILMGTLDKRITQGVTGISGGDPLSAVNTVGTGINASIAAAGQVFDSVQRVFNATFNPASSQGQGASSIEPTTLSPRDLLGGFGGGLSSAGASHAHLLVLTAQSGESYYFNLSTAGFDTLRRQTSYNVASQDRLTRRTALQAVSKGGESITVSGAIFTRKSGGGQLNRLRDIGYSMTPLNLITGYGDALGRWYLTRIEEEQSGLFTDGMPRKQQFTLEFQRYGEDYTNL